MHNSYLLLWAELGLIGLIGLLSMLLSMVAVGRKAMRRLAGDERSELMIGMFATVVVVSVHLAFEWLLITNYVHYLLAMNGGALVSIIASLQRWSGKSTVRQQQITVPDVASQTG